MDIINGKLVHSESDMADVIQKLKNTQKALLNERRQYCDMLHYYVTELYKKQKLYDDEIALRNTQLSKVQKILLFVEARLIQEQQSIHFKLTEKDYIISKQRNRIKQLLRNKICSNCQLTHKMVYKNFYSCPELVITEQENCQSSPNTKNKIDDIHNENYLKKNEYSSSIDIKDVTAIKPYLQILQHRNDNSNKNNVYPNCDKNKSTYTENHLEGHEVSSRANDFINKEHMQDSTPSIEHDKEIVIAEPEDNSNPLNKTINNNLEISNSKQQEKDLKLTEMIPFFEDGGNDNWYASASDQEDEECRDIYRNNPVLECMNQILLHNISDVNSPPKTPNTQRKNANNKTKSNDVKLVTEETITKCEQDTHDYYETPIQKTPNFYESPQSIYSNDYEQILSKFSDTLSEKSKEDNFSDKKWIKKNTNHYIETENCDAAKGIIRKNKILRTPPALPPKPPNLLLKCKIPKIIKNIVPSEQNSIDLEPDYCSISELNLPQMNKISMKMINVIADVHVSSSKAEEDNLKEINTSKQNTPMLNPVNPVKTKCINDLQKNYQFSKTTEEIPKSTKKKMNVDIPKLPQVSEIIFPDELESVKNEDHVCYDNYVKNNTQITKTKNTSSSNNGIVSDGVSKSYSKFEESEILKDIKRKHEILANNRSSVSFHTLQSSDKQSIAVQSPVHHPPVIQRHSENKFDLNYNFEEFKLDDYEIEEYDVEQELLKDEKFQIVDPTPAVSKQLEVNGAKAANNDDSNAPIEIDELYELQKKNLNTFKRQCSKNSYNNNNTHRNNVYKHLNQCSLNSRDIDQNYENFLECKGLSSKSIVKLSDLISNNNCQQLMKPTDMNLRSQNKLNRNYVKGSKAVAKWSKPFV